jgi:hypothetical protein
MLRTTVFLPQSIYNEKLRDFILAYEGAGAYGNFLLGGAGELDYHVFGGTLNVPDPSRGFWNDTYSQAGMEVEDAVGLEVDEELGNPAGTAEAEFRGIEDPTVSFPWVYGGALIWNTPLEGLRVGTTYFTGEFIYEATLEYDVNNPPGANEPGYLAYNLDLDQTSRIQSLITFSGEYTLKNLTLAAEADREEIDSNVAWGWYASADYRFSRILSVASYYADAGGQEDTQEVLEDLGLPDYYGWQRDLTIACRLDLTDFWLFKLEYHFIAGVALAQNGGLAEEQADPKARKWGMFAARTTFHF